MGTIGLLDAYGALWTKEGLGVMGIVCGWTTNVSTGAQQVRIIDINI